MVVPSISAAFHKFRDYTVISTGAPVLAFARKHRGEVEKSIFEKYFLFRIVVLFVKHRTINRH